MGALKLIEEARSAGLKLRAEGDRLVIRGPRSAEPLAKALLDRKAEILPFLREQPARPFLDDGREDEPGVVALLTRPHINARGELIIPFNSDPRFHWWNGGQSILDTLRELGAPPEVVARYVDSQSSLKRMQ